MHSTLSLLLLISKRGIFLQKIILAIHIFLFLALLTSQVVRPEKYPTLLGLSQRDRVASWKGFIVEGKRKARGLAPSWSWPGAQLALRPPAQQPASRNASNQVSPRAQKTRQSTNKAGVAAIHRILG